MNEYRLTAKIGDLVRPISISSYDWWQELGIKGQHDNVYGVVVDLALHLSGYIAINFFYCDTDLPIRPYLHDDSVANHWNFLDDSIEFIPYVKIDNSKINILEIDEDALIPENLYN